MYTFIMNYSTAIRKIHDSNKVIIKNIDSVAAIKKKSLPNMFVGEVKHDFSIAINFHAFVVLRYFLGGSLPRKTGFLS
jgi:hypothetical protein